MDCADIKFSDNAANLLIATAINDGNLMDCAEYDAGVYTAAIGAGLLIN